MLWMLNPAVTMFGLEVCGRSLYLDGVALLAGLVQQQKVTEKDHGFARLFGGEHASWGVLRASEAFRHKTYVESKSHINGANPNGKTVYIIYN